MQRRSLAVLIAAVPAFLFYLGETSGARPVKLRTWPALQAGADLVLVVSVTSTKEVANGGEMDATYFVAQESRLRVLSVLKGENVPPHLQLYHFRDKRVHEGGSSLVMLNGPGLLKLKLTPEREKLEEKFLGVNDHPTLDGQYLAYLNKEKNGRVVPVSGQMDPIDSVFALSAAGDHLTP